MATESSSPADGSGESVTLRVVTNDGLEHAIVDGNGEIVAQGIEAMAESGELMEPVIDPIPGSHEQLSFAVESDEFHVARSVLKAKMPTEMQVDGQFQPDDLVKLVILGRVKEIGFSEITDRNGTTYGMKRTHRLVVERWRVMDEK